MTNSTNQLAALADIQRVVRLYARGLDRLDAHSMADAYWADAVDERFDGQIAQHVDHMIEVHRGFAWTMHCLHNHVVDFDSDDQARGEVYVVAHLRSDSPAVLHTFFGRYLDRYERRSDQWRISHRACVHEGSQQSPASPTPWVFTGMRDGSSDRPPTKRPIGP